MGRVWRSPGLEGADMLDVILIAAGFGFFVVAIAYEYACDRI
jgi:hypothetical protein